MLVLVVKSKWDHESQIIGTLFYGLVKNHAFRDGNKRTALLTLLFHLWLCGRTVSCPERELELLTVAVAENRLRERYSRYAKFEKRPDPEVNFLAWYIRKNTRLVDRTDFRITYRELQSILRNFNCELTDPKGNQIDVVRHEEQTVGVFKYRTRKHTVRVCTAGFPGWKSQVSKSDLRRIRDELRLTVEYGIDSQVFFKGVTPVASFISTYHAVLRRLAYK